MSATLKFLRRLVVESANANLIDWGSVTDSVQDTACTGSPIQRREFSLDAGDSVTVWDWATEGDFTIMLIECDGFGWIAQKVDKATDPGNGDYTAAGTAVNYAKEGMSCFAPLVLQGMDVPVVASSTNYAASAFHATTAAGRRYAVYAKNPADATDSITVTVIWVK